jgi:hypothetical protein
MRDDLFAGPRHRWQPSRQIAPTFRPKAPNFPSNKKIEKDKCDPNPAPTCIVSETGTLWTPERIRTAPERPRENEQRPPDTAERLRRANLIS